MFLLEIETKHLHSLPYLHYCLLVFLNIYATTFMLVSLYKTHIDLMRESLDYVCLARLHQVIF